MILHSAPHGVVVVTLRNSQSPRYRIVPSIVIIIGIAFFARATCPRLASIPSRSSKNDCNRLLHWILIPVEYVVFLLDFLGHRLTEATLLCGS
jgi:hypothetical protein